MTRRGVAIGVALLVAAAGCLGGGAEENDPIEASAGAATVPDATVADAGYADRGTTTQRFRTNVTVSIQGDIQIESTREVNATLAVARYDRTTDAGTAVFAAASSPAVYLLEDTANVSRNPLATVDTAALVDRSQDAYDVSGLERTGATQRVTVLGNETDLTVYGGIADGGRVTVYVGTVRAGADFVSVVAVVPADADEREQVLTLAKALEH
ncbi:MAG: DUF6517 family protein [Haloglomus sp.]